MSRSSRLAFCITELEPGGAERCLTELVTRLDRQRFDPIVYCLASTPSDRPSLLTALEAAEVPVRVLGAHSSWQAPAVVRRLALMLRQDRPRLLQTFLFHANIVGRIAARRAGVPRVVSGIRVAERRRGWYLRLDRLTGRLVDRHVCVSQAVADFSHRVGRLPAERLTVIPNGVDVQRFVHTPPCDLRQFGIEPGRRTMVFVGRLDEQKRAKWLVELTPRWRDVLSDYDLLLVGDGPDRTALEQLCQRPGSAGRVHMAGWRNDVPSILRACELLLLPSSWEGMPNVVLEAMAAGLPVVSTDVEGVRELLGSNAECQIAPIRNTQLFLDKLVAIATQPDISAELGLQNRARACEFFSFDVMVQRYSELYESLLGGPSEHA